MVSDSRPSVAPEPAMPRRLGAWVVLWMIIILGLTLAALYGPRVLPLLASEGLL